MRRAFLPASLLVACTVSHADVTVRMQWGLLYRLSVIEPGADPQLPIATILTRIKGNRAYSDIAPYQAYSTVTITDLSRGEVTLIDPKSRRYATITMMDYLAKLANAVGANMSPGAKRVFLKNKRFDFESHDAGRSDKVNGIDVIERETTANFLADLFSEQQDAPRDTIEFRSWTPRPSEFERMAALRELAAYYDRDKGLDNPATVMIHVFGALPGVGESASKMVAEIFKNSSVVLRMQMRLTVLGFGAIMDEGEKRIVAQFGRASKGGETGPGDTKPEETKPVRAKFDDTFASMTWTWKSYRPTRCRTKSSPSPQATCRLPPTTY
jgi:hypothetical protein